MYSITGEIWMPMIAHAAFDLAALSIIYFDIETKVAHLFF
jgi:membrane protease YdiL (CAAX protease family)